jgi:hypothetical protein
VVATTCTSSAAASAFSTASYQPNTTYTTSRFKSPSSSSSDFAGKLVFVISTPKWDCHDAGAAAADPKCLKPRKRVKRDLPRQQNWQHRYNNYDNHDNYYHCDRPRWLYDHGATHYG